MSKKTCSIVVTTIDDKEIKMQCTPDYLKEIKIILKELRPLMQGNASDGVIRLWKLGKSDHAPPLMDRLIGILQKNIGNEVLDIVWDDMIDLQVEYPPVIPEFIFLGENLIIRVDNIKSIVLSGD